MMRSLNNLTAQGVKSAKPGKHLDGGGQWVLRVMANGRRREMGLSPWPSA